MKKKSNKKFLAFNLENFIFSKSVKCMNCRSGGVEAGFESKATSTKFIRKSYFLNKYIYLF